MKEQGGKIVQNGCLYKEERQFDSIQVRNENECSFQDVVSKYFILRASQWPSLETSL